MDYMAVMSLWAVTAPYRTCVPRAAYSQTNEIRLNIGSRKVVGELEKSVEAMGKLEETIRDRAVLKKEYDYYYDKWKRLGTGRGRGRGRRFARAL